MYSDPEHYSLIAYSSVTMSIIGILLIITWWLGKKSTNRNKELPYESGIIPSRSSNVAMQIPFYLVAIFFIVFDVETAFIFTWAIVWDQLGMTGLLHISFFIIALLSGLLWLLIRGGLDWGPSTRKPRIG